MPIPGGGVPLNMREVEELERMTKDFIKDMDTHAPVITSTPTGTYTLLLIQIHFIINENEIGFSSRFESYKTFLDGTCNSLFLY